MLTLKLIPQLPTVPFQSCLLTLPPAVTFYHLHAALELILQPNRASYYSFMLMASRHAIEANIAEDYKAAPAFSQNPQIRYLNPYPGTFACLLELESIDNKEAHTYPRIKGSNDDSQINIWLKEYCDFTKDWQYQNKEFFQKLYQTAGKAAGNQKADSQKTNPASSVPSGHHFKTMEEKQHAWYIFREMYEDDESIRVTVGTSRYSQAELLEASKKNNLLNYCRYALLPVSANWKKRQLAEAFCSNLKENTWLTMVLLPRTGLELYFRLCRLKENQKLSLNPEEAEVLKVLIYLGITDLILTKEDPQIRLELSADFKKYFQEYFQDSHNFKQKSACTVYLSPELKAGSWQKTAKGYEKLDYRVSMLLYRFGILSIDDLCDKLCTYYLYTFNRVEFKIYLMLHLRLLEGVYTGHLLGNREQLAASPDLDISYALAVQKNPIPLPQLRPIRRKELDEYGEWISEQTEGLMHLLIDFTEDMVLTSEIIQTIVCAVLGNYKWEDYLEIIGDLLEDLEDTEQTGFWYQLSKLYLYLPVAGLGGYSRMEYAAKEQSGNPYLILNDPKGFPEIWEEETVFGLPFEVQWQLFSYGEQFVKDGSEISEKRMIKYAGKYLNQETVFSLQVYCYMISGNPRLIKLLQEMAGRGNAGAQRMLEELEDMLSGMDEDWDFYE